MRKHGEYKSVREEEDLAREDISHEKREGTPTKQIWVLVKENQCYLPYPWPATTFAAFGKWINKKIKRFC
jgi:hypothetical protein